jgi:acyl-CoA synthetase (NDP forming)
LANGGSIGLVSQSGNLGTQLLAFAEQEGIGIRSFCGSGNESMITVEDYLNGLGQTMSQKPSCCISRA